MIDTETVITIDGTRYTAQLATVRSTELGEESDVGIATAWLNCEWPGGGIGVGGDYCLDTPLKDKDGKFIRRAGTGAGMDYIFQIMKVVGVRQWEKVPGNRVWILFKGEGPTWGKRAVGIAGVDSDEALVFEEFWKESKSVYFG